MILLPDLCYPDRVRRKGDPCYGRLIDCRGYYVPFFDEKGRAENIYVDGEFDYDCYRCPYFVKNV